MKRWLFGYGRMEAIAVLRILYGGLAALGYLMEIPYAGDYYAEGGLLPTEALLRWQNDAAMPRVLLHASPEAARAFVAGLFLLAVLTCVGRFTRPASILLALGTILIQNRNPLILNSGDGLIRMMLILIACAPSGAVWSMDRLLALRRGAGAPPLASMWPQRLMAIQLSLLYLSATWFKWYGPLWRNGTAAWYPMQMPEFRRFPVPAFTETPFVASVFTYGTLTVELLMVTAVWFKPTRTWVLLAALLFHAALDWRLNIPLFGPITVAGYVAYYDGGEVRRFFRRVQSWIQGRRVPRSIPPRDRPPASVP